MKCEECGGKNLKVLEKRITKNSFRRRRECQTCGHRMTTYEMLSDEPIQQGYQLAIDIESLDDEAARLLSELVRKMQRPAHKVPLWIKRTRKLKGLRAVEVAEAIDIDKGTVWRVERGEATALYTTIQKISQFLYEYKPDPEEE